MKTETPLKFKPLLKNKLFLHVVAMLIFCSCSSDRYIYSASAPDNFLSISKFDVINRIVAGTFTFKVSTISCGTIEATDGRFDVKY